MRLVSRKSNILERPPVKETPQIPVDERPDIDIYLRPGVAEDLVLFNSWFQNPIVNRFSQMPMAWKDTLNWWKGLGEDTVISMIVLTDKSSPMSFYCGRTIGYIQLSNLNKEIPYLYIVIGDFSVSAMGIGTWAMELAGKQLLRLKNNGQFYSIVHPEAKIALSMVESFRRKGIIQSVEPMDSGWIIVNGKFA